MIESNAISYIRGAPEMPKLEARVAKGQTGDMTIEWRIEIKTERSERGIKDNINIPQTGVIELAINQAWKLQDHYIAPAEFFGGSCSLYYRIKGANGAYLAAEQKFEFKIRGKNPKDADARAYIDSISGVHRYAWAIAQHETRSGSRVYNQFNTTGSLNELPFFGSPDGWGLFQIDRSREGGITTAKETYDWKENTVAAIAKLDEKRDTMDRFLRWIRNKWGSDPRWQEPPENWTFSTSQFTLLELGTIVLYNGAGGINSYVARDDQGNDRSIQTPWKFDPTRSSGQRWYFEDNENNYTAKIVRDEWEHGESVAE